jgi:type IV secretory pathway VirB3-like protein
MKRAPIYPALWQPILTAGVPRDYALVALIFSALFMALISNRIVGFGMFAVLWLVGWFFAKIDPEFFSVFLVRWFKIRKTEGSKEGNVYHP